MFSKIKVNKYKLLLLLFALLLFADMFLHKGLVYFLFNKSFDRYIVENIMPIQSNPLINKNKNWIKAVNNIDRLNSINNKDAGIECDIYYDTTKQIFDVHHDLDNSMGLNFETILEAYHKKGLQSGIWMDFKNLHESNAKQALNTLLGLRNKYSLSNKILVESTNAKLLQFFSKESFYTSYYTPYFNPYLIKVNEQKIWADSIARVLRDYPVNALSGYYFQMPFLHKNFPDFPILIWSPNDQFSFVNWLYKRKIASMNQVFIALYN